MIYIVRHGETDWNAKKKMQGHTNTSLNNTGRAQAEALSKEVTKLDINCIISSDLSRARETAEIINKEIGLDIIVDKRIRERCFGDFEGRVYDKITEQEWKKFNENPKTYNAETRKELFDRAKEFLGELKANKSGNVLVVTHGGTMKAILFSARHNEFNEDEFQKDYWQVIPNASIIELS